MLSQAKNPELERLWEALDAVLSENDALRDPRYLSRSALDMCLAANWDSDRLLAAALDCARRYWAGQAPEQERENLRTSVVRRAEELRRQGRQFSPEWCKYALVMSAMDVRTTSDAFAAEYLLEFALKAQIPLAVIRGALEANVPGLTEALARHPPAESGTVKS